MGVKQLNWDPKRQGGNIKLSNNNQSVTRGTGPGYQSVLANVGFDTGTQFWTMAIDIYGHEKDVFIGVTRMEPNQVGLLNYSKHLIESGACWGWMCTDGTKIGSTVQGSQVYGDYSKIGEELGV